MNNDKLCRLERARGRIVEIDKEKKEIFEGVRQMLGLESRFDNDIWDYLINGLQFLRNDIAAALKNHDNSN